MSAAAAAVSGNLTYEKDPVTNIITITGHVADPEGAMAIPATIHDPISGLDHPVKFIAGSSFVTCKNLTSVTIASGVESIGNFAFSDCSNLTNVTIPASVTTIGRSAFSFCTSLPSVSLPFGVATIGNAAFGTCTALASVTIPSSLTTLGTGVFGNCTSLLTVTIPSSLTSIPTSTFNGCSGLTSVTLPSTISSIGTYAFQYCGSLTSVTIPPSVTILREKVFANCRGLTSVEIPAAVTSIHPSAFDECSSLSSFTVAAANTVYSAVSGLLTDKAGTLLITCPAGMSGSFNIPSGITGIGPQAFRYCGEIISVGIPGTVTSLGTQAFSGCVKLVLASFMGNAPTMGSNVFELTASGFSINFLNSSTGFTSPTWMGYPATGTGEGADPLTSWLVSKGLPANSNLMLDANGDGVNLLMAYALDLNPNVSNSLPAAVFGSEQMSLSFYAGTAGITYVVKASSDLLNWSTEGVTLSAPDLNQIRTATVAKSGTQRFMRLEVSH